MQLRAWRKSQKLTLVQAAEFTGISLATLSRLERGLTSVLRSAELQIYLRTDGAVTPNDLFEAWCAANPEAFNPHGDLPARDVMRLFIPAAETKETADGQKGNARRARGKSKEGAKGKAKATDERRRPRG